MSVLNEILDWSKQQPEWQQDTLRRILETESLNDSDYEILSVLCKAKHGLIDGETPLVKGLTEDSLPTTATDVQVVIRELEHIKHVNALPEGQKLSFSPVGLTVVYGDNAAGKSGYARILKKACRARGVGDEILPNILSQAPAGTPCAKIFVGVNGNDTSFDWKEGHPSDPILSKVSVFDSNAASVYTSGQTDVAYRPLGLDILDKLARACEVVRGRLDKEKTTIQNNKPYWPSLPPNTSPAMFLTKLTPLTNTNDIDRIATLSDNEKEELKSLQALLAAVNNDPLKQANEIKLKIKRFEKIKSQLESIASIANSENISKIQTIRQELQTAEAESNSIKTLLSERTPLTGVGTDLWKRLWISAKEYSDKYAYEDINFPNVAEEARCVLCQQPIAREAIDRFNAFVKFMSDESQTKIDTLKRNIENIKANIVNIHNINCSAEIAELKLIDSPLACQIDKYLDDSNNKLSLLIENIFDHTKNITAIESTTILKDLSNVIDKHKTLVEEIIKSQKPEEKLVKETRKKELEARATFNNIRDQIIAEVKRLQKIQAYEAATKDTQTRAITGKSTELTKKYVSQALADAFAEELKQLQFNSLELELKPVGGQKGALYHKIVFKYASQAELSKVVSEGESRCLSLAAFLAEIKSAENNSAIIFDDPVCSLDHVWRERIAKRLADECKIRQVIVFTHDLVFVDALRGFAKEFDVSYKNQHVYRDSKQPGIVSSELPWIGEKVGTRIGILKQEHQKADKLHRQGQTHEYEIFARYIYGRLRETWERAVEEILLADVVNRFRKDVQTKKLNEISSNETSDYADVDSAMTKCSALLSGHDQPAAVNTPIPGPNVLKQDIDNLEEWVNKIRKRRK